MANVLIVGSGPTGLIMACELISQSIPVRLIDRLEKPVTTSRSFTIHARTLELLEKLDLTEKFLQHGHPIYSMDYHFYGKEEVPKLDFRELNSFYPFCLIINQSDTEALLRERLAELGGNIEWNTKVTALEQTGEDTVLVTMENTTTGETEQVQYDWVIGCDGFASTVRKNLNLPFDGEEHAGEMKMMDVGVRGFDLPQESIYYFITKEHLLLMTKLPGKNYRVLISDLKPGANTETARETFQVVVDQHFGGKVVLDEPEWTTVFKTSKRKVDTYRQNRVLLAGDAAHINSPAGGQGMNVSMQDAFNLAWKLALVVKCHANVNLIDTYEKERLPVAAQLHEGTQYLQSIIMAHGTGIEERIALTKAPGWNRKAVNQIAGISYTYRSGEGVLIAGDRAPDVCLNNGFERLYQAIDPAVPTVLFILSDADAFEAAGNVIDQLQSKFTTPFTFRCIVPPSELAENVGVLVDESGDVRRVYGEGVYIIRPDRHIDFISENYTDLLPHLEQYFV